MNTTNALAIGAIAIGGSLTMLSQMDCRLATNGLGGGGPGGGDTGGMDAGRPDGNGSSGGSGGSDGGMMLAEPPSVLRPALAQTLPPTRGYLLWKDGAIPAGLTVSGYEVCSTTDPVSSIDNEALCPNATMVATRYLVLDPLTEGATELWKVRTRFSNGSSSAYSGIQNFMTDHSLVGWWKMNGDANDSSVSGDNGTLQNGVGFGSGIDGKALSCNGVNQYADMGANAGLNLPGPLTLSAWVYGNSLPASADSGIVNNGVLNYALTYHTNGRVYFYIENGGNSLSADMAPNAWHHVTGVFDGTTNAGGMRLYLDGASSGTRASSAATTGAMGSLWMGRYNTSYFNGLIDNVTFYNDALTDAAVLNEYCATQAVGGIDPTTLAPCAN